MRHLLPALLCLLLLAGCSTTPMQGQLNTKDGRPLVFSSEGSSLVLNPGLLGAELGTPPDKAGSIKLKNNNGEIAIKTRPENFQLNHFRIDHTQGPLSADVKGVWRENTDRVFTAREVEGCTTAGFCLQTFPVTVCWKKDDGKQECRTHYESRMRMAPDCPGTRLADKTYQAYTVTLELEFLNPANPEDRLALYQGNSPPRQRLVHRQEVTACVAH